MLSSSAAPSFYGGGGLSAIDENTSAPLASYPAGKPGHPMAFATPAKMQQPSLLSGGPDVPLKLGTLESGTKPRRALGALSSSQMNVRSLAPTPQKAATATMSKTPSGKTSLSISVHPSQAQTKELESATRMDDSFTDEDMICSRLAPAPRDPADIVAELAAGRTLRRKQQAKAASRAGGGRASAFAMPSSSSSGSAASRSAAAFADVSTAIADLENSLLMSGILSGTTSGDDFLDGCCETPNLLLNIDDLLGDIDG